MSHDQHNRSRSRSRRNSRSRSPLRDIKRNRRDNSGERSRSRRSPSPSYYRRRDQSPPPRGYRPSHGGRYYDPKIDSLRSNAPEGKILAVFGIHRDANEDDIYKKFRRYNCKEVKLIYDKRV
jgi:hypothetical protein